MSARTTALTAALAALLSGLVFGVGLIVSGMANPAKVQGFLDLAGPWDPSLALVMAGAIGVGLVAATDGKPQRRVVAAAVDARERSVTVAADEHPRGGVAAALGRELAGPAPARRKCLRSYRSACCSRR